MVGSFIRKCIRSIRKALWTKLVKRRAVSCGVGLTVNYYSRITSKTKLGSNVNMNGLIVVGGGEVSIGDNFHSGRDCIFITTFHNYEGDAIPYDNTVINRKIEIGDNVWIGTRVMILGGVEIGEGSIIQAGSVVVSSIPPCSIAGGHPAKVFKMRNTEHYYRLKALGKTY